MQSISINKTRLSIIIVAGIVLIVTAYYIVRSHNLSVRLADDEAELSTYHINDHVLTFTKLFADRVLNSNGTVDLETRLQLENGVRAIKNEAILAQWNKFTGSKTETEAQNDVKKLLTMLLDKIQ